MKTLLDGRIQLSEAEIEMLADELEDGGIEIDDDGTIDVHQTHDNITEQQLLSRQIKYYGAEHWYPLLHGRGLTMDSVLVSMLISTLTSTPTQSQAATTGMIDSILTGYASPELTQAITTALISAPLSGKNLFVKLNSVSPKDTGLHMTSLHNINSNTSIIQQIVKLLSSSRRVCDTLKDRSRPHYLFLREFWPEIMLSSEFRVFVTNRQCVACSQNNTTVCDVLSEAEIKTQIVTFCQSVMKLLWYNDCTLDVVYLASQQRFYLIEVNTPYYLLAGTALFDQEQDADVLSGTYYAEFGVQLRMELPSITEELL